MELCSQIYTLLYSLGDLIGEFTMICFVNYLQMVYICTISHFYYSFYIYKEKFYPIA